MHRPKLSAVIPDIAVVWCCTISAVFSVLEAKWNIDPHHWGFIYVNAADWLNGRVPYREIFIQYGPLSTWVHALSLKLFGNNVVSIGIMTGIFYALSIYLCYLLWQKIMDKWLSCVATVLMFLIHPYIIYPWPNYISYTFLLLCVWLLSQPSTGRRYFLAGIFFALNVMARHNNLLSTLAPILLFFAFVYLCTPPEPRKAYRPKILWFHGGMLGIFAIYFVWIVHGGMLADWLLQNVTITGFYQDIFTHIYGTRMNLPGLLLQLFSNIILANTNGVNPSDIRVVLYSLIFLNALVIFFVVCWQSRRPNFGEKMPFIFLYASQALFGYMQGVPVYEVFRLHNAAALGIGLLLLSLDKICQHMGRWKLLASLAVSGTVVCLSLYLASTMIFTKTSSVYFPWQKQWLANKQMAQPNHIAILQGKWYDFPTRDHYERLHYILNEYRGRLQYLVNFTADSYLPVISDGFMRVQRAPFFHPILAKKIFRDELQIIAGLIKQELALLILSTAWDVPANYRIVYTLDVPESVAFREMFSTIYIAIPQQIADTKQNK